jgi:IS4 transposase
MSAKIDLDSGSKKLFFKDFTYKLLFCFIYQIDSLRGLSSELQTNQVCKDLSLEYTPFSTLKDGFSRFDCIHYKTIFENLVKNTPLFKVPYLEEMGIFKVIDGTLLPTLLHMSWTQYRKNKNAFKLHFSFELNRMIPTEFWRGTGNSCERTMLLKMVQSGITYIADKGYFSFDLVEKVIQMQAFFILRVKENMLFEKIESFEIAKNLPVCFKNVSDAKGVFKNDPNQNIVRLVHFQVWDSCFMIVTNRFDLSTLNIIILYAYRWQIELFFKYLKRTLNGIHLLNHSENGIEIQFYLMMTLAVLQLNFKQTCQAVQNIVPFFQDFHQASKQIQVFGGTSPSDWIKKNAKPLYVFWKISKNWLLILKNSLTKIIDNQLVILFSTA